MAVEEGGFIAFWCFVPPILILLSAWFLLVSRRFHFYTKKSSEHIIIVEPNADIYLPSTIKRLTFSTKLPAPITRNGRLANANGKPIINTTDSISYSNLRSQVEHDSEISIDIPLHKRITNRIRGFSNFFTTKKSSSEIDKEKMKSKKANKKTKHDGNADEENRSSSKKTIEKVKTSIIEAIDGGMIPHDTQHHNSLGDSSMTYDPTRMQHGTIVSNGSMHNINGTIQNTMVLHGNNQNNMGLQQNNIIHNNYQNENAIKNDLQNAMAHVTEQFNKMQNAPQQDFNQHASMQNDLQNAMAHVTEQFNKMQNVPQQDFNQHASMQNDLQNAMAHVTAQYNKMQNVPQQDFNQHASMQNDLQKAMAHVTEQHNKMQNAPQQDFNQHASMQNDLQNAMAHVTEQFNKMQNVPQQDFNQHASLQPDMQNAMAHVTAQYNKMQNVPQQDFNQHANIQYQMQNGMIPNNHSVTIETKRPNGDLHDIQNKDTIVRNSHQNHTLQYHPNIQSNDTTQYHAQNNMNHMNQNIAYQTHQNNNNYNNNTINNNLQYNTTNPNIQANNNGTIAYHMTNGNNPSVIVTNNNGPGLQHAAEMIVNADEASNNNKKKQNSRKKSKNNKKSTNSLNEMQNINEQPMTSQVANNSSMGLKHATPQNQPIASSQQINHPIASSQQINQPITNSHSSINDFQAGGRNSPKLNGFHNDVMNKSHPANIPANGMAAKESTASENFFLMSADSTNSKNSKQDEKKRKNSDDGSKKGRRKSIIKKLSILTAWQKKSDDTSSTSVMSKEKMVKAKEIAQMMRRKSRENSNEMGATITTTNDHGGGELENEIVVDNNNNNEDDDEYEVVDTTNITRKEEQTVILAFSKTATPIQEAKPITVNEDKNYDSDESFTELQQPYVEGEDDIDNEIETFENVKIKDFESSDENESSESDSGSIHIEEIALKEKPPLIRRKAGILPLPKDCDSGGDTSRSDAACQTESQMNLQYNNSQLKEQKLQKYLQKDKSDVFSKFTSLSQNIQNKNQIEKSQNENPYKTSQELKEQKLQKYIPKDNAADVFSKFTSLSKKIQNQNESDNLQNQNRNNRSQELREQKLQKYLEKDKNAFAKFEMVSKNIQNKNHDKNINKTTSFSKNVSTRKVIQENNSHSSTSNEIKNKRVDDRSPTLTFENQVNENGAVGFKSNNIRSIAATFSAMKNQNISDNSQNQNRNNRSQELREQKLQKYLEKDKNAFAKFEMVSKNIQNKNHDKDYKLYKDQLIQSIPTIKKQQNDDEKNIPLFAKHYSDIDEKVRSMKLERGSGGEVEDPPFFRDKNERKVRINKTLVEEGHDMNKHVFKNKEEIDKEINNQRKGLFDENMMQLSHGSNANYFHTVSIKEKGTEKKLKQLINKKLLNEKE